MAKAKEIIYKPGTLPNIICAALQATKDPMAKYILGMILSQDNQSLRPACRKSSDYYKENPEKRREYLEMYRMTRRFLISGTETKTIYAGAYWYAHVEFSHRSLGSYQISMAKPRVTVYYRYKPKERAHVVKIGYPELKKRGILPKRTEGRSWDASLSGYTKDQQELFDKIGRDVYGSDYKPRSGTDCLYTHVYVQYTKFTNEETTERILGFDNSIVTWVQGLSRYSDRGRGW